MTEAAMFAQGVRRQEKALWPLVVLFSLIGLVAGIALALPLTIEPQVVDAGATVKGALGKAGLVFVVLMFVFLGACMVLKHAVSVPAALIVGAVAALGPIAGPFIIDGIGGAVHGKERGVLVAHNAAYQAGVKENEARLAAADLGVLVTKETVQGRDFDAYRARVKSFRDASDALKSLASGREAALRARLTDSGVATATQEKMLATVRAQVEADAPLAGELHALRIETADLAGSAIGLLADNPQAWRIWYDRLSFYDPQLGADFGRQSGKVRTNMAGLRRLEGKRQVIGATAQKQAS